MFQYGSFVAFFKPCAAFESKVAIFTSLKMGHSGPDIAKGLNKAPNGSPRRLPEWTIENLFSTF